MRTEIPLLQNVRIASPCSASWEQMTPIDQDRVRFCDGCQKRVYNLSALCQAEAEGLLRAHEGHLCVRYYRRHDGTILTADCPVGLRAARRLVLTRARVSIGLCLLLCAAFAAHQAATRTADRPAEQPQSTPAPTSTPPAPQPHVQPLMGAIAPQPPAPIHGRVRIEEVGSIVTSPEMGDVAEESPRVRMGKVAMRRDPLALKGESEEGMPKTYDRER